MKRFGKLFSLPNYYHLYIAIDYRMKSSTMTNNSPKAFTNLAFLFEILLPFDVPISPSISLLIMLCILIFSGAYSPLMFAM